MMKLGMRYSSSKVGLAASSSSEGYRLMEGAECEAGVEECGDVAG